MEGSGDNGSVAGAPFVPLPQHAPREYGGLGKEEKEKADADAEAEDQQQREEEEEEEEEEQEEGREGKADGEGEEECHDEPGADILTREQRFEAALSCREEGKGVKPRQGCASVQLNRECKEGTRTAAFVKFLETCRQTADAEVLDQFGTNADSYDRADFMKVERPLHCAIPPDSPTAVVECRPLTHTGCCCVGARSCRPGDREALPQRALAAANPEELGQG